MLQDYEEYVNKFKPKLTSDDTFTPDDIYEDVLSLANEAYGLAFEVKRID